MACFTSVGGLLLDSTVSQTAHQVLVSLAQLMGDTQGLDVLQANAQDTALGLTLLPRQCPTLCVARVFARAVVAPVEHALKDACPYQFNLVRHSWNVQVERFPSQTIVTHSRTEQSAPGHEQDFQFSWSVSFILRNDPLEITELFIELTNLEVGGSKSERMLTSQVIEAIFTPR